MHKNNWLQSHHDSHLRNLYWYRKYSFYCSECQNINQVVLTPVRAVLTEVEKHMCFDLENKDLPIFR